MADTQIFTDDCQRTESLIRLLHKHFQRCQGLVTLENAGEALKPDMYRSKVDVDSEQHKLAPTHQQAIKYEKILSYSRNEPRLELIKRSLERLAKFGTFRSNNKSLSVDAFRLRNLESWANYPVGSPESNFPSISSYCNCDCDFCYERGTRET